jgi:hypothetical protein
VVPHYLPGTNPDVGWFAKRYNVPLDVIMSGAGNMYPEIRTKIPRSMGGFGPEPAPSATPPRATGSRPESPPARSGTRGGQ